ncbi:selenocysteine lyase/cysteine desulfurase [Thermocatellispora tengchongensis]|uniref:Selenocysteine lyase/cysteine desulfurase n=1 Tax=Thermocatellispora tengchongensis TaxID=1073253 RepID=A0A840PLW3_9ACTN|nr:aminotransferase class V-fold PLP-dependent enzyme [Thermocatellispora tengchongensis]MBB5137035.1 selenocysteine lyase/cysteine desulfurase [Thermocatellispora tengchongensis]
MTTHLTDLAHLPMHRIHHLWDAEPGWLDTASYGLPPRHAHTELTRVLDQWRRGSTDWTPWEDYTHRARHAFATLVAAPPTDITIGATASQLLSMLAAALPPGTTVLAPEIEFTSNLFPWAVSATLRTVPPDHLAESIDASTGVVAFSLVQSATGQIAPAADIIAAARHHGALVVADASQACGWLPIDATRFDVLVCAAYKWLMSPRGAAYAYLSPRAREHMRPIAANWYAGADPGGSYYGPPLRLAPDARAFDLSPAWFCQAGAAPAIETLNAIGIDRVHAHNTALAARFQTALGQQPTGSAIVTVEIPDARRRLAAAGVRAAVRAGKVRASFHIYTTDADVDLALNALT